MLELKHPIKIVFFDIDETLYSKDKCRIPDSITQQVLPRLKAKGIIPAIATGRAYSAFPSALMPLINQQGFELFVTINGQYNFYQTQLISQYGLSQQQIERCIHFLKQLNIAYGFVTTDQIAVSENNLMVHEALSPIKADYIVDAEHYRQHNVMQLLAFYPQERDHEIFNTGIFQQDLKVPRWHQNAVDILCKQHSKAQGIKDVIKHFNLNLANTLAFGDGFNDLEMLETVGVGVAMGNAEEAVKQLADFVTKPINEDGILYALEHLNII
ncbi:hydrolase [[Haemophilus] ducreyi]|uniref:Uncharacterized protein n=2 Tax=Haemophilus ducreyi TaxID=730 RepID=Q7VP89_HAEDU|nr:Cof-type HAD-IIB family hydrolase [[Haemophilus] ducreyi]AAP95198.1 hypothetical protein HD_0207 [[Haemophilus] ducreyi 35000HP]AKO30350.1 hydrolase [[Haemophilus] ducreyi]AKO31782.1 hydrolase [[Haemophilus] ducreyi]AKO33234.1 hydrolase [[Haemophilus] ducreyi]AKO34684.1 hydrolase [[Haemophilus] ducreyi]